MPDLTQAAGFFLNGNANRRLVAPAVKQQSRIMNLELVGCHLARPRASALTQAVNRGSVPLFPRISPCTRYTGTGKGRMKMARTPSEVKRWVVLIAIQSLVLVAACGTSTGYKPSDIHSDILSKDHPLVADLMVGDTLYQYLYANDPDWEDAAMVGRIYIRGGAVAVQDWRQVGRWPVAGVDTVWVWLVAYRAGTSSRTGQGIVKFLLSDPEWGLAVESNQSRPRPRIGAAWERVALPLVVVGRAFDYLKR